MDQEGSPNVGATCDVVESNSGNRAAENAVEAGAAAAAIDNEAIDNEYDSGEDDDLKPANVKISQRTSKYMSKQRKEKNTRKATENVDKLVVPNLRSETVEELVSASLQVLDEMAPVRRSDANAAHGDYKLALQLKTAQGEATREAIRRQEEDAKIGLEVETVAHAEDDLEAPTPGQQRQQQADLQRTGGALESSPPKAPSALSAAITKANAISTTDEAVASPPSGTARLDGDATATPTQKAELAAPDIAALESPVQETTGQEQPTEPNTEERSDAENFLVTQFVNDGSTVINDENALNIETAITVDVSAGMQTPRSSKSRSKKKTGRKKKNENKKSRKKGSEDDDEEGDEDSRTAATSPTSPTTTTMNDSDDDTTIDTERTEKPKEYLYRGKPVKRDPHNHDGDYDIEFLLPSPRLAHEIQMLPFDKQLAHEYLGKLPYTSELEHHASDDITRRQFVERIKTFTRLGRNDPTYLCCRLTNEGLDDAWGQNLARVMVHNNRLESLLMNMNEISDECTALLCRTVETHPKLRQLSLGGNDIGDASAWSLGILLQRNTVLESLNLSGKKRPKKLRRFRRYAQRISHQGVEALANGLMGNKVLMSLNLAHQDVGDEGANALAVALSANRTLNFLNLKDALITHSGAFALGFLFKENKSLKTAVLAHNDLGDDGGLAIADSLRQNKKLQFVEMDHCNLSERASGRLLVVLQNSRNLISITLHSNHVGEFARDHAGELEARGGHEEEPLSPLEEVDTQHASSVAGDAPDGQTVISTISGGIYRGNVGLDGPRDTAMLDEESLADGGSTIEGGETSIVLPLDFDFDQVPGRLWTRTDNDTFASTDTIAAEAATIARERLAKRAAKGQGGKWDEMLPVRSQIFGHKDSTVNYMHLRVEEEIGDESEDGVEKGTRIVSVLKAPLKEDAKRDERKAIGRTERHQRVKSHELKIVRFHQDRYRPNAPPLEFVTDTIKYDSGLMKKYPKGIDQAALYLKKLKQTRKKGDDWGDETTGIVYQLAKQKH